MARSKEDMEDYKKLIEEVLKRKPSLDERTLLELIEEKRRKVGSGYLTEQGALFLVAGDLGITFDRPSSQFIGPKDVYVGAGEVTVAGRVLSVGPMKSYSRKDGSGGRYRRMVIFDTASKVQVTAWDDSTRLMEQLGIKPGMAVKVVRGYVRPGLDGSPVMNIGNRGTMEVLEEEGLDSHLPKLDDETKDLSALKDPASHLVVKGVVSAPPRSTDFVKKDGSPGKVVQLRLRDVKEPRTLRVALWNPLGDEILSLSPGALVRIIDLRAKVLPHGELELHGSESTVVEVLGREEMLDEEHPPRTFRLLSIGKAREWNLGPTISCLSLDKEGRLATLLFTGNAVDLVSSLPADSVITCSVSETSRGTLVCEGLLKLEDDHPSLPSSSEIYRKASEVKGSSSPIIIEVIALSRPETGEIMTKDGSSVLKAELLVGDETGEVRVVGWRDLSSLLDGISPGHRLRLRGVQPKEDNRGATFLQLTGFSSVEKL